jgi:hypothetical protein
VVGSKESDSNKFAVKTISGSFLIEWFPILLIRYQQPEGPEQSGAFGV